MNSHKSCLGISEYEGMERLGSGAMGIVYRAQHRATGTPVALKVLANSGIVDPRFRDAFRREIRSVAGLDHPNIITILDYGEVRDVFCDNGHCPFTPGQPYFVMELATQGQLRPDRDVRTYRQLHSILLTLLDALAHTHARGILHCDIKPTNILMGDDCEPSRLTLADFGIARLMTPDEIDQATGVVIGTPSYMAPEQFSGRWRDCGPWTDLYSLGCVAYELVCGRLPFVKGSAAELAIAHTIELAPPLTPRFPVPPGFETWVFRMLAKEPLERFIFAADAARSLVELGKDWISDTSPVSDVPAPTTVSEPTSLTATFRSTLLWKDVEPRITHNGAVEQTFVSNPSAALSTETLTPIPPSWDSPTLQTHSQTPPHPRHLGPRLFLLRPAPLVGRRHERDFLWESLRRVAQSGLAHAVAIRGLTGVGKSRLVQWVGERAYELGSATVWRAFHDPRRGRAHGIAEMVARHLGCLGLTPERVRVRLEKLARSYQWDNTSIVALIGELIAEVNPRVVSSVPYPRKTFERHLAAYTVLQGVSRYRPLFVWLDDVQWGEDSLDFVHYVLNRQSEQPAPLLFVMTAQDESLADNPVVLEKLEQLVDSPSTLNIPPLSPEHQRQMLEESFRLNPELSEQVMTRTEGNPLFAHQLVVDWIERDILEQGEQGFRLAAGQLPGLPKTLRQVWAQRIERLVVSQPESAARSLDVACALGIHVDQSEWEEACRLANVAPAPELLETLQQLHLVVPTDVGFSFVHGMLRETLQELAQAEQRWDQANRACAAMLTSRAAKRQAVDAERIGRHFLEAGDILSAIEPLMEAAETRLVTHGIGAMRTLIRLAEQQLSRVDPAQTDRRWASIWIQKAVMLWESGQAEDAFQTAAQATDIASLFGHQPDIAKAHMTEGRLLLRSGKPKEATVHIAKAKDLYHSMNRLDHVATCLRLLGVAGDFNDAASAYQQAIQLSTMVDDVEGKAYGQWGLAVILIVKGDLLAAKTLLLEALSNLERHGGIDGQANVLNSLGEVCRRTGDIDRAEDYFRKSAALFTSLGLQMRGISPQVNLALLNLLERRDFAAADNAIQRVLQFGTIVESNPLAPFVELILATTAVSRGDVASWDVHFPRAETLITKTGTKDQDLAAIAQLAGELAEAAGDSDRAYRAYELAEKTSGGTTGE